MRSARLMITSSALLALLLAESGCAPQDLGAPTAVDWPMYRGNLAGTGYSPLTQITTGNVAKLTGAWNYSLRSATPTGADGPSQARPREPNSQVTPIVVGDVMYLPAVDRVVALEATTGAEIWQHAVDDGAPSRRGVAYWPGANGTPARIIFTAGRRLVALDAATGTLAADFGQSGEVDMVVPYNSVPLVYENIVVVGANTPRGTIGGIGNARAYDARTGAKLWEFSSVPQPGSVGHDSWEGDSWQGRLGANAWPFYFTMDEQRGHVYLPLASPIPFAYGGDRGGANLFANALVAVDIRSGAYVWHFQTIHHDLWDADPPAPPVLFALPRAGGTVDALGVTTKSGYLYILDRETGEPIFGVEERPVPASDVPGELTFPTQPFPVKPQALSRVSYEATDLVTAEDTSPEHAAACAELVASVGEIYNAGPFSPWVYREEGAPPRSTLLFPGLVGGPNWGGAAFDPNSGYVFVFSQDLGALGWMEEAEEGSAAPYRRSGPRPSSFDVRIGDARWPCQKPPWGRMTAVHASTGDIVWERAIGITEQLPADRQNTGRPGRAAAIVTAGGLLFVASTDDNRLRALEAATGRELWVSTLDRRGNANPMTYLGADGAQYVVIVATDAVVAYKLP
ncbi:MAG: PQQ-binding-like beta-propeller repeat protein [Gemmatimonadetes bacterium]|nr:PQQ-binding-like beta-propeller repeat protein [Gemmatimonadota bacterium]